MTRVVAYVRVSTDQQADAGWSLEAQQEKLAAYAKVYDLQIIGTETDAGESASTLERPGLQRALERLDNFEAEGLLVVKLDRLTRNVRDLCTLVDRYFKDGTHRLLSVSEQVDTSSASGRLVINILTVVSQWERETIGERTSAVMKHMKATGMHTGGFPPFGFYVNDDGQLVEHAVEQEILEQVRYYRNVCGYSYRSIIEKVDLNPRTGRLFDPQQIRRMVQP